jgi:hypothetical protein
MVEIRFSEMLVVTRVVLCNIPEDDIFEFESVFDKFPKYRMKMPLGDFTVKVGREGIYERQLGIEVFTKLVIVMELKY